MKKLFSLILFSAILSVSSGQEFKPVSLLKPDKTRGYTLMKALDVRASATEWSDRKLTLQDLSDLLWAANGINRPAEGKKTAPSAMNAQDIDIYAFTDVGIYLYDAQKHILVPVINGDFRSLCEQTEAPVTLVLISDISRFRAGNDSLKIGWANIDAGTVSQNISLFCSATGLKTRPKVSFPGAVRIRELLKLNSSQYILLNHPVGYAKN
jgi:hypothetical protein